MVIRRAIAAGYPVRSLLVTSDRLAGLADLADRCDGPGYVVPPEIAHQVTGYRVHRGALASMRPLPLPPGGSGMHSARRAEWLEHTVDRTEVGTHLPCCD